MKRLTCAGARFSPLATARDFATRPLARPPLALAPAGIAPPVGLSSPSAIWFCEQQEIAVYKSLIF